MGSAKGGGDPRTVGQKDGLMDGPLTNRGLVRVAVALAVALVGLFLFWRFLIGIAETALVLLVGVLLAVVLSGPVEALHRRKVPRLVASLSIVLGILDSLALVGYLPLPVLIGQAYELIYALPYSFSQIGAFFEQSAYSVGLPTGEGPSLSTVIGSARRILGGALGLFGSLASLAFGLIVAVFLPLCLTANPKPAVAWLVRLFPPASRPRAMEVFSEVRVSLLNWLKGRLLSMVIVGVLWVVALYLIGVPGALFLSILGGLLELAPYVGPVMPPCAAGPARARRGPDRRCVRPRGLRDNPGAGRVPRDPPDRG